MSIVPLRSKPSYLCISCLPWIGLVVFRPNVNDDDDVNADIDQKCRRKKSSITKGVLLKQMFPTLVDIWTDEPKLKMEWREKNWKDLKIQSNFFYDPINCGD